MDIPERIVLALETFGPGGAENMVLHLADELRARGASPTILISKEGWMQERALDLGFPVWVEPQHQGPDVRWIARMARRLRREQIQMVHTHEFDMNAYAGAAAVLASVPNVATFHGKVWGLDRRRHRVFYRVLRPFGQVWAAVSHDLAGVIADRLSCSLESVRVVHNGIAVPDEASIGSKEDRAVARRLLGVPEDLALIVAVGSLFPVKDHTTLLRATKALPQARLAIAGRGPEKENLQRLAAELNITERVHFLGLRDDVSTVLGAADVFVQSSISEGLPLAVLEAMAACRPVVATRVGGIEEAVVDGMTGLTVEPANPSALSSAIGQLVDNPIRAGEMALKGQFRANERFSVAKMTDRYCAIYEELR